MAFFRSDSITLSYSNIELARQWWIEALDCKVTQVPTDGDNALPSDVALKFPGCDEPTIPLSSRADGPIDDGGDMQFFEIRDTEGNLIQIRQEF